MLANIIPDISTEELELLESTLIKMTKCNNNKELSYLLSEVEYELGYREDGAASGQSLWGYNQVLSDYIVAEAANCKVVNQIAYELGLI